MSHGHPARCTGMIALVRGVSTACTVSAVKVPVCADVDRDSGTLTAETVQAVLTPRTKAIIPVHLAGWPCDMDPILKLACERGIKVIEDCAQAHGAKYKGKSVGSFGDVAAWSFCQDKIMSTGGEGGMLTTNDAALWERCWAFKDHGKSYDAVYRREHKPGFRWLHESFGSNWRLTEMQSAMGRALLQSLDEQVAMRRAHAEALIAAWREIPALRVPVPAADRQNSYYKFYAYVRPEKRAPGWSRDRIVEAVNAEGVPCFSGSCSEIYLEKAFGEPLRPKQRFAVAKELGETSLMFLVHPTLTEEQIQYTATAVAKVMAVAGA